VEIEIFRGFLIITVVRTFVVELRQLIKSNFLDWIFSLPYITYSCSLYYLDEGNGEGCNIPQEASAGCLSPFLWPLGL